LKAELFAKYLNDNFEDKDSITITSGNSIQQRWFRFRAPKPNKKRRKLEEDEVENEDETHSYRNFYKRNSSKLLRDICEFSGGGSLVDGRNDLYRMLDSISKDDNLPVITLLIGNLLINNLEKLLWHFS
jgi:hypothetical protein